MHDGWRETTLGEIANLTIGRTPPRKESRYWANDLTYPFLSIAEMNGKYADPVGQGVTPAALGEKKAKLVPAGALLMSFKLTIGKIAFATRDMCTNEAIVWIEPDSDSEVTKEYLALALEVADLNVGENRAVKGATLNRASLEAIEVSVPPLEVQRRIVDLIGHIDLAMDQTRRTLEIAINVWRALCDECCSAGGERVRLENLVESIAGPAFSSSSFLPANQGVRLLRGINVRPDYARWDDVVGWPRDDESTFKRYRLDSGDVVIAMDRPLTATGQLRAVRLGADDVPSLLVQRVARLRARESELADWVEAVCHSPSFAMHMGGSLTGGHVPHIKLSDVDSYEVAAPEADSLRAAGCASAAKQVVRSLMVSEQEQQKARKSLLSHLLGGQRQIPDSYDRFLEIDDGQAA